MENTTERDCLVCHKGKWVWVVPHVAFLCGWDSMHACDQKSTEWKQRRMHMLTASAIATALDMNPYDTREALIQQYAGVGKAVFNGNDATRHGELHEDTAVAKFEEATNETVLTFGLMPFLSNSNLHLGGSVDGITAGGALIEVKCPYRRKPNGAVPKHYMPQLQSLMCGLNLHVGYFVEYVPESTWVPGYFCYTMVDKSARFLDEHHAYLREFWYRVCMCREGADALCFTKPRTKKRRRRPEIPLLLKL